MSSSLFAINEDHELLRIGVIYSIIAISVLPLYALVIYALHVCAELRTNISYRLMNVINYCDVAQAACHFLTGLFIIFPNFTENFQFFVRVVGCTANSLWLAMFPVMSILAVTRILISFNKSSPTKWNSFLKVSLAVGFFYVFLVWLIGCVTQNFQLAGVSWSYDFKVEFAELFASLEIVLCFPTLALSFASYLLITFSIYKKRRVSQHKSLRMEVTILIQATILTAYMAILITFWHNAENWFKMTNTTIALLNGAWIMFSYLNPILLITTNSGVQKQIVRIFTDKYQGRHSSIGGGSIRKISSSRKISAAKIDAISAASMNRL